MVVFSSMLSYVILSGGNFIWENFVLLSIGGMFVTFGANALNQVLERDFDRLMERTKLRPLPDNRMNVSLAVLISGLFCLLGIASLGLINPLASLLGMLSFVMYTFVYTPLKRYSTLAVPVGAIPGALPVLIGAVAAQGTITVEALCLFAIQYLWQFPHFWAIAWLGHDDYTKTGFKLIADIDGKPDPLFGIYSAIYTSVSLLICIYMFVHYDYNPLIAVGLISSVLAYVYFSIRLYTDNNRHAARALMFCSILYLPCMLILFTIQTMIG